MSDKTDYLELTLPDNGEFTDNWDSPVNQNFEDLDDHLSDLNDDLVGSGGDTSTLATTNLKARLAVAMDDDGVLNLESADDFTDIRRSKIYPVSGAATNVQKVVDRIHEADRELLKLRFCNVYDRYGNVNINPDPLWGIAPTSARHGSGLAATSLQSPIRGFTPNCVVDGPLTTAGVFTASTAPNHLSYAADSVVIDTQAVDYVMYNIDGVPFKADVNLAMEFSGTGETMPADNTYWLYVSRNEGDYGAFHYKSYNGQALGAPYEIDPRVVPISAGLRADVGSYSYPDDGSVTVGNSTLTSAAKVTAFDSWGCQPGDILVIQNTSDALDGEYPIAAVSTDNVTIAGEFPATSAAVEFYVLKPYFPSFGWVSTAGTRTAASGRVYIGTFTVASSVISAVSPLAYNGVYDTGWDDVNTFSLPITFSHFLGEVPTQVEIWLRKDDVNEIELNPTVLLTVEQIDKVGDATPADNDVRFPAIVHKASSTQFSMKVMNPHTVTELAHDYAGNIVTTSTSDYSLRVILRR